MCLKKGLSNPKTGLLSGQMSVANTMRNVLDILADEKKIDRDKIAAHILDKFGGRFEIAILECVRNTY